MKNYVFLTLLFCTIYSVLSQEKKKEVILQYPFDEISIEESRGVYGSDNRKDVKDAEGIDDFVRATAVLIHKNNIIGNRIYGQTLREKLSSRYGTNKFDENVKFLDQPTSANCTGFLLGPDILVTAGHCILTLEDAKDYVWVFNYTNERTLRYDSKWKYIEVSPDDIYEVSEIISSYFVDDEYNDYSVLRLNKQSSRKPYRFRTSGKPGLYSNVYTIGSPTGLPLKFADNAYVVNDSKPKWFKNSIDTFPGNSGGPVFNQNGFIEGIHVRGAIQEVQDGTYRGDYKYDQYCDCVKTIVWSSTESNAGAQAHRINSIPNNTQHQIIYENVAYAIKYDLKERLNDWLAYRWMIDYDYTNNKGRFEEIAVKYNNLEALKLIIEKSETDILEIFGAYYLDLAIQNSSNDITNYLIEYAKENDNLEMYKALVESYIESNNIDLFSNLEQYGISLKSFDNNYLNSLIFKALNDNSFNVVYVMLDNGWEKDLINSDGNSLLHMAAFKNDINLIEQLINKKVYQSSKNNFGKRPEDISKQKKNRKAKKALKKVRKKYN